MGTVTAWVAAWAVLAGSTGGGTAVARAVFDGSTGTGPVPHVEYLDGTLSTSTAPGGWKAAYAWDFGDGTPVVREGWVEHAYTQAGVYVATLTVTDSAGSTDRTTLTITVGTPPPGGGSGAQDAGTPSPDAGMSPPPDAGVPDAGRGGPPPGPPGTNPVALENAQAGDTGWQLQWASPPEELSGYLSTDSAAAGEQVVARVHSASTSVVRWLLYRVGWYGGAGGRKVAEGRFTAAPQPTCPVNTATGLVECAWAGSFNFTVQPSWTSGVYLVRLLRDDGRDTHLVLTVRDGRRADLVVQQSVTTWQAYNRYGGESLYEDVLGLPGGHATTVSFARPYATPGPAGQFFEYEMPAVRWVEAQGYDATYVTNLDFSRSPDTAQRGRVFLSLGHDEYWSLEQRDALERARAAGTWQAYLSANSAYWRVRVEAGADGPFRRLTCFKDTPDPLGGAASTVRFRDPPLNRPENGLLGAMYEAWHPVSVPLVVAQPSHWLFAGTGLRDGDALAQVVGYEADRLFDNGWTPPGTQVLAEAPLVDVYGRPSWHQLALHPWSSGAQVLAAGSIEWGWALSVPGVADARLQRVTANFLGRAGAVAATPGESFGAADAWGRADFTGSSAAVLTVAGIPGVRGAAHGAPPLGGYAFHRGRRDARERGRDGDGRPLRHAHGRGGRHGRERVRGRHRQPLHPARQPGRRGDDGGGPLRLGRLPGRRRGGGPLLLAAGAGHHGGRHAARGGRGQQRAAPRARGAGLHLGGLPRRAGGSQRLLLPQRRHLGA